MSEKPKTRKTDQEELWLSVSKTKSFLECRARFNFAYNLKLPQKDNQFTIFGRFNHVALEHFHLAFKNGSTNPLNIEMNNAFKIASKEFEGKISKEDKKESHRILGIYLRQISEVEKHQAILDKTLPENRFQFPIAKIVGCEQKFQIPILEGKIVLNGMIDRVQIDGDNVVHVADYKTIQNKKYLHNNDLQLLLYAWVMMQDHPDLEKVRCSYVLLRHDFEWVSMEFTREDTQVIENQFAGYREEILNEKEFAPTTSQLCSYCSFLDKCEAGQKKARVFSGEVSW